MKRPIESDYTSHVAYTRALEKYCNQLEQPASNGVTNTHGEPVEVNHSIEIECQKCGATEQGVLTVTTSPQPTPEHIKAMWFALNILEQSRLTTSNKIIRNLCQQAIADLQSALKGMT